MLPNRFTFGDENEVRAKPEHARVWPSLLLICAITIALAVQILHPDWLRRF